MKKIFKIFILAKGYHGDRVYYASTPQQLDDVTYEVSGKTDLKTEEAAIEAIEKCEERRLQHGEFVILPIYTKK